MKQTLTTLASLALVLSPLSVALPAVAATPNWNAAGSYVVAFNYLGTDYAHDMTLAQDGLGALTGSGGSPTGAHTYAWTITSGSVSADAIDFTANYTSTADAVTPQTTMHVVGTIAPNGTMSGTWSDNYQGSARSGTWTSTSGAAVAIPATLDGTLAAEDFGVVNYDTGLGMLKGYTAGFGLSSSTFAGAQSVVVQLYAGATLLQTNTAILPKFNADITGAQVSSPFDVSGTFAYATDGYWTNVRAAQYGQSVPATRVVATVKLANGKIVTAENTALTGDPTTIYPTGTTTPPVATTTGMISGQVYNDVNKNEKKDSGEVGIPGFTIKLYNHAGWSGPKNQAPLTSVVTDANGNYSFANLPDGTYSIEEINQDGWKQDTSDYKSVKITNQVSVVNRDFGNYATKKNPGHHYHWGWNGHGFSWKDND